MINTFTVNSQFLTIPVLGSLSLSCDQRFSASLVTIISQMSQKIGIVLLLFFMLFLLANIKQKGVSKVGF